jgi:hypothetical protein
MLVLALIAFLLLGLAVLSLKQGESADRVAPLVPSATVSAPEPVTPRLSAAPSSLGAHAALAPVVSAVPSSAPTTVVAKPPKPVWQARPAPAPPAPPAPKAAAPKPADLPPSTSRPELRRER